jgi:hypothetical protein
MDTTGATVLTCLSTEYTGFITLSRAALPNSQGLRNWYRVTEFHNSNILMPFF